MRFEQAPGSSSPSPSWRCSCSSPWLGIVREALPAALDATRPDLVIYHAGLDPYVGDPLAQLRMGRKDGKFSEGRTGRTAV
jgi:hypothetical protein